MNDGCAQLEKRGTSNNRGQAVVLAPFLNKSKNFTFLSSKTLTYGAREKQVDELKSAVGHGFIGVGDFTILAFEFEAYPEPKNLKSSELRQLIRNYGNSTEAAEVIGSCEAFVRQKAKIH